MKITFLQAANGDCILMQGGGHNVLIDRGKELSRHLATTEKEKRRISTL